MHIPQVVMPLFATNILIMKITILFIQSNVLFQSRSSHFSLLATHTIPFAISSFPLQWLVSQGGALDILDRSDLRDLDSSYQQIQLPSSWIIDPDHDPTDPPPKVDLITHNFVFKGKKRKCVGMKE